MNLTSILSFLKSAKAKVGAIFVAVFGQDAAQKFADGSVALLKTAAGVLAKEAVVYAATLKLGTPTATRDAAASKLASDAKSQGIELTNSLINLLIEVAVQAFLKGNITLVQ